MFGSFPLHAQLSQNQRRSMLWVALFASRGPPWVLLAGRVSDSRALNAPEPNLGRVLRRLQSDCLMHCAPAWHEFVLKASYQGRVRRRLQSDCLGQIGRAHV